MLSKRRPQNDIKLTPNSHLFLFHQHYTNWKKNYSEIIDFFSMTPVAKQNNECLQNCQNDKILLDYPIFEALVGCSAQTLYSNQI